MVTTAELGLDLARARGRLPLDEDAVRATYSRFELHVPTAIRALTLREPTRTVDRALRRPALERPRHDPSSARCPSWSRRPAGPAYVQEALF